MVRPQLIYWIQLDSSNQGFLSKSKRLANTVPNKIMLKIALNVYKFISLGISSGLLKQEINIPPKSILHPIIFVEEYLDNTLRG